MTLSPDESGTAEPSRSSVVDLVDHSDRELLRKISAQRDTAAMETFFRQFRPRLVPFLNRLIPDHALVDEVFNDVMMTVWRKGEQYGGRSKVSTWVFSIAYRAGLKAMQRSASKQARTDSLDDESNPGITAEHPDSHNRSSSVAVEAERQETQHALRAAVERLPAKQRLALELCYFLGYSVAEISTIVECPENTVKTRLHHGRKGIRAMLESTFLNGPSPLPSPTEGTGR